MSFLPAATKGLIVDFFSEANGKKPAADFIRNMRDPIALAAIKEKLDHIQSTGQLGTYKGLTDHGAGINEFRLHHRGGQRIYFMERSGGGLLILGASDKDGQAAEITRCIQRRQAYKEATKLSRKLETELFRAAARVVTAGKHVGKRFAELRDRPSDRLKAEALRRNGRGGLKFI